MSDPGAVLSAGDTGPVSAALPDEDALRNLCFSHPLFRERYVGWEEVGRGAFATVVRTHCVDRDETVALKIFRHSGDEEDRRRFRSEVQNAQRILSPLLVRTYSPFDQGGLRWIEMEYVDGTNLEDELQRRDAAGSPFTLAEALDIATCVTAALALAHRENVIHRDLKPANVLLPRSRQPVAKLADFGIARLLGAERLTSTGIFAGTPKFGSPEAFLGDPLGTAHDVYSLGLTLYLLFTGNHFPFALPKDYSLQGLVAIHTRKAPLPARTFAPELDPRLEAVLARCLDKKPRRRPTVEGVLAVLEGVRAGSRPGANVGPQRSRRWLLAAAGVAIAVATVGWSVAGRGVRSSPESALTATPEPGRLAAAAPEPETKAASTLVARVSGGFLELRNTGDLALSAGKLELVTASGRVHRGVLSERIGSGEVVFVPLDELGPAADPGEAFVELRMTSVDKGVPVRITHQ